MIQRPEILFPLFASVGSIKGIGSKTESALTKIGITRTRDLIFHLPITFQKRHQFDPENLRPEMVRFMAVVEKHDRPATKGRPYRVHVLVDAIFPVQLVFFHAHTQYIEQILPIGQTRAISGKLERYGDTFQIAHPDFIRPESEFDIIPIFEPIYGLTEGITQNKMATYVHAALKNVPELPEWIPNDRLKSEGWVAWSAALEAAHHVDDETTASLLSPARLRLAFDELYSHQLAFALARNRRRKRAGRAFDFNIQTHNRALEAIGFQLTGAQMRAVVDIGEDLQAPRAMNRLLQGDVGSGKTAVAFLAMIHVASTGAQAVMMAPTEILARQHGASLTQWCEAIDIEMVVLTGRDKGKKKDEKIARIAAGQAKIIIGTHAVFQDNVEFHDLGLVVIDEQHRFGVRDRQRLTAKGDRVDVLLMSATPIPRTLTLSIYGEMDISILDEKPPNRQKITTAMVSEQRIPELVERIAAAIGAGRQVYWVCPLVAENEKLEATAAEARYEELCKQFGTEHVGLVHGQMNGDYAIR